MMECSLQVSLHGEPPKVGLVKMLTGGCISGWKSSCQPLNRECYRSLDDEEVQEFPVFVRLRKGTSNAKLDP